MSYLIFSEPLEIGLGSDGSNCSGGHWNCSIGGPFIPCIAKG
jgi:hypothetical protein